MLQQPSEPIMYQKLPLDLNSHSAEISNLHPELNEISLQFQARRAAAATHAFFLDAYSLKSAVPSSTSPAMAAEALRPAFNIQGAYANPFLQAAYDPIFLSPQKHIHNQHHQRPHHHLPIQQQQQHAVAMAATPSVELWQQQQQQQRQQLERRGCWFPNWQEVFHGFSASKNEKLGMNSSPQQQAAKQDTVTMRPFVGMGVVCNPQQLNVHPDGGDLEPLSSPLPKHDATPLPLAEPHDRAQANGIHDLLPASSIVPCAPSSKEQRNESSIVPFTRRRDPSLLPSAGDIFCKYITESPAWLPPGWITEVQTRRSGATAGTRDKYYKDLVTGRRFRSRNEVIHYLQTGKGRLRRRRRRKAIASSASGGHVNYLAHQPFSRTQQKTPSPCLFLTPKPIGFVLGPLENLQSANIAQGEEASCQTPVTSLNMSSTPGANHHSEDQSPRVAMFGLKRPVESSRPQKLPVHKKTKILPPRTFEDKQASRLWQWLHKPVRTDEQLQKQDAQNFTSLAKEKKAPDIHDLGRPSPIEERTAQLSREVEAAHRTLTHLGKEMQATIEKLTQRVYTAKRDLKLEAEATHKADHALNDVMQATHRLDNAVGCLTEATQSLVFALGNGGVASPAAKQPQAAAAGIVQQRAPWPDVAMVESASNNYASQAAESIDHGRGNAGQTPMFTDGIDSYDSEPPQGPHKSKACESQATAACVLFTLEPSHRLDNPVGCITQAPQVSDGLALNSIGHAQRSDLAMYNPTETPQCSISISNYASTQAGIVDATGAVRGAEKLSRDEYAYLKVNKQIMVEKSMHIYRFPALNPDLDLSLLSPSLSSRQRAKEVQKMKAKYGRELLGILGRKLCYKALLKICEDDVLKQW